MRGPPTRLLLLYLGILPLEPAVVLLACHRLLDEIFRPLLLVQTSAVPLCGAFNDRACLRECRHFALPAVLFVVPVWVQDGAHLEELEVAF